MGSVGKDPPGATKAFKEFERRFTRLPEREQRSVGADKVLLFVRSIDRAEREAIGIELEDDDGANGLTEDWSEVERVCRRLDEERSAKEKGKMTRDGASSRQEEPAKLDVEALVREAFEALKAMVDEEEGSGVQTDSGDSEIVGLPDKAEMDQAENEEWYDGTTGEGVERGALSTCGELPTEDKVGSGEEPSTQIPETLVVEPVCRHEAGEQEGAGEESWHDASEEGWESAYEEVEDGDGTGESGNESRPDQGSNWSAFRFGWSVIRMWIIRPKPTQGARGEGRAVQPDL